MYAIIQCVVSENIHTPPRKGSDFPGGKGGHHREIFPEGSRDA